MTIKKIVFFQLQMICLALSIMSAATAAPCDSPEHRAFDFWLGEWQVWTPQGKFAGINRVTLEYGGCVIHEHYTTGRGFSGESLNTYDAGRKVWHQTWVDNSGMLLLLEGGMQDGRMVLEGEITGTDKKITRHRISFTPNDDGSVRQHWESTSADGKWETAFDGKYTKK